MLFFKHPFSQDMPLDHALAKFQIPAKQPPLSEGLLSLLEMSLKQDPRQRASSVQLCSFIEGLIQEKAQIANA